MAELGVIASVVGIATAGIALATRLHDLVDQFGSTFDDIEAIANDLNGFSIVLDELSRKLNLPESGRAASNQLIRGIEDIMRTCQVLFKDINTMIATAEDSNTKLARLTTRILWVFRKNKIKGVKATLECQKATLSLMLQILRSDNNSLQRTILKNLLRQHNRALRVLESIQKENEALKLQKSKHHSTAENLEKSTVYLPGDVSNDSGHNSSTQSAMVLLSNTVPRLLGEASTSEFKNGALQNSSKEKNSAGVIGSVTEVPPVAKNTNEVDLLVAKWIRPSGPQAWGYPSSTTKLPPNLSGDKTQQYLARDSPISYPPIRPDSQIPAYFQEQAKRPIPRGVECPKKPYEIINTDDAPEQTGKVHFSKKREQPIKQGKRPTPGTSEQYAIRDQQTHDGYKNLNHNDGVRPRKDVPLGKKRDQIIDRKWEEIVDTEKEEEEGIKDDEVQCVQQ